MRAVPLAIAGASLALFPTHAAGQPAPARPEADSGDRQVVERLEHLLGIKKPAPSAAPAPATPRAAHRAPVRSGRHPSVPGPTKPERDRPALDVTPIVPEPDRVPERAYQLYWEVDVPVLAVGIVLTGATYIRSTEVQAPAHCLTTPEGCDANDLNALDRPFAGRYSPAWATASDVGLVVLMLAPYYVLWPDQGFWNMVNDSTVINQAVLLSTAFQGIASLSRGRGRPYVYGDDAPDDVKYSTAGSRAYFSEHTSYAFAMSTSLFWTVNRRRPGSVYAWAVLAGGTAVASFIGVARVMAGEHFPTDVIAGAAVGAGMGTLVPALHDSPVVVAPVREAHGATLNWIGLL